MTFFLLQQQPRRNGIRQLKEAIFFPPLLIILELILYSNCLNT
jgi:hypothetical protein